MASSHAAVAQEGSEPIQETVAGMPVIQDASTRIGDIMGTIDSIAFRAHILALNAAVGVARACEQGLSFAVVATEVRPLAQRSALAATEIQSLIGNSASRWRSVPASRLRLASRCLTSSAVQAGLTSCWQ